MTVKTRFAPSPTGYLHIGGARTALFSWLYARHHGGQFVLRIEDTDLERSTPEAIDAILAGMDWLGLDYDEGPFYQTRRFDRYKEVLQQLLDQDKAYYCYCTREELDLLRAEQTEQGIKPRYDRRHRDYKGPPREGVEPVIRFKNPIDGEVVIDDIIHGPIVIQNSELDDLIIARADGSPTYNFCVVVDDMDMEITHVIRGDDHINNTPRQINILKALDAPLPRYAHVPMIQGDDGKKLSKRHGAVSVLQYREQGYLPEALLNYLVRLGWSHGDQEIFDRDEMTRLFDLDDVNKGASAFNTDKLRWLNQHYFKTGDPTYIGGELVRHLTALGIDPADGPDPAAVVEAYRERAHTLVEMAEMCAYCYRDFDDYDPKATKQLNAAAEAPLRHLHQLFSQLDHWQPEPLHDGVKQTAETLDLKLGKVAQPLRVALTGSTASPGIDVTLMLIGRERTLRRIEQALNHIAEKNS